MVKLYLRVKGLVERFVTWAETREPIVVINAVTAAVAAFVTEAQGDLTGAHAWVAVAWAVAAAVMRHFVTPAKAESK